MCFDDSPVCSFVGNWLFSVLSFVAHGFVCMLEDASSKHMEKIDSIFDGLEDVALAHPTWFVFDGQESGKKICCCRHHMIVDDGHDVQTYTPSLLKTVYFFTCFRHDKGQNLVVWA